MHNLVAIEYARHCVNIATVYNQKATGQIESSDKNQKLKMQRQEAIDSKTRLRLDEQHISPMTLGGGGLICIKQ